MLPQRRRMLRRHDPVAGPRDDEYAFTRYFARMRQRRVNIKRRPHIALRQYLIGLRAMMPGIPIHAPRQVAHAGRRHQRNQEIEII